MMKPRKLPPPRVFLDTDLVSAIADYLEQQTKIVVLAYGIGVEGSRRRYGVRSCGITDHVAAREVNNLRYWRMRLRRAVNRAERQKGMIHDIRRVQEIVEPREVEPGRRIESA